jgi:uncharacterized membrane protein
MKMIRIVCCFCLLMGGLLALYLPGFVSAQEEEEPEEKIELAPLYPRLEEIAGGEFVFEVEFRYVGSEARDFNLRTTAPQGWEVHMTPPYEKEKNLSAIRLQPAFSFGNKLRIVATAPFLPLPDPGEYMITLEAVADGISSTTELTAVVTSVYNLITLPTGQRYNTSATSGRDNFFSIEIGNLGTAAIDNIEFSSTKPEGWTIEFTPEKIESLDALDTQTIDINIKPTPETIAGDYSITLKALGKQRSAEDLNIRVTVESPTIWGWVGVAIIVVVVAGLIVIFMRFSRR